MQEWTVRQTNELGHSDIGVKDHKTGAVASFALSQVEELVSLSYFLSEPIRSCSKAKMNLYSFLSFLCQQWFDICLSRVRPQLLNARRGVTTPLV